jgi:hypothetical protein
MRLPLFLVLGLLLLNGCATYLLDDRLTRLNSDRDLVAFRLSADIYALRTLDREGQLGLRGDDGFDRWTLPRVSRLSAEAAAPIAASCRARLEPAESVDACWAVHDDADWKAVALVSRDGDATTVLIETPSGWIRAPLLGASFTRPSAGRALLAATLRAAVFLFDVVAFPFELILLVALYDPNALP